MGIENLLSRYHSAQGKDSPIIYTIERLFNIDGHEVAWMRYEVHPIYEVDQKTKELIEVADKNKKICGYDLKCECDFTEGIGWEIDLELAEKTGEDTFMSIMFKCLKKRVVSNLRILELREEYFERFSYNEELFLLGLNDHPLPSIIEHLIEKAKSGEFIGEARSLVQFISTSDSENRFCGEGYFYLNTVARITRAPMDKIWEIAENLAKKKKISLEGSIVLPYVYVKPVWKEYAKLEIKGITGVAYIPGHSRMEKNFKFEILDSNSKPVYKNPIFLPLSFGLIYDDRYGKFPNALRILSEIITHPEDKDIQKLIRKTNPKKKSAKPRNAKRKSKKKS